jgi:hypothetical protein
MAARTAIAVATPAGRTEARIEAPTAAAVDIQRSRAAMEALAVIEAARVAVSVAAQVVVIAAALVAVSTAARAAVTAPAVRTEEVTAKPSLMIICKMPPEIRRHFFVYQESRWYQTV